MPGDGALRHLGPVAALIRSHPRHLTQPFPDYVAYPLPDLKHVGWLSVGYAPMGDERDLTTLLREVRPELHPGRYVFTAVAGEPPPDLHPVATMAEAEGLTLVLPKAEADAAGLGYDYEVGWITLRVRSALDAVGLTAAVAGALAEAGLSCNVVAGFHHDHLFVPYERAAEAVAVLEALAER